MHLQGQCTLLQNPVFSLSLHLSSTCKRSGGKTFTDTECNVFVWTGKQWFSAWNNRLCAIAYWSYVRICTKITFVDMETGGNSKNKNVQKLWNCIEGQSLWEGSERHRVKVLILHHRQYSWYLMRLNRTSLLLEELWESGGYREFAQT